MIERHPEVHLAIEENEQNVLITHGWASGRSWVPPFAEHWRGIVFFQRQSQVNSPLNTEELYKTYLLESRNFGDLLEKLREVGLILEGIRDDLWLMRNLTSGAETSSPSQTAPGLTG